MLIVNFIRGQTACQPKSSQVFLGTPSELVDYSYEGVKYPIAYTVAYSRSFSFNEVTNKPQKLYVRYCPANSRAVRLRIGKDRYRLYGEYYALFNKKGELTGFKQSTDSCD